jgi:hypothetical protein
MANAPVESAQVSAVAIIIRLIVKPFPPWGMIGLLLCCAIGFVAGYGVTTPPARFRSSRMILLRYWHVTDFN